MTSGSHFEFFTILQHRGMNTEKEMCISYTGKVLPFDEACPYTSKETLLRWGEFSEDVSKLQLSPEELALMLGICVTFRGMYNIYIVVYRKRLSHVEKNCVFWF